MKKFALILAIPFAISACGGGTSVDGHDHKQGTTNDKTTQKEQPAVDPNAKEVTINLSGGDDMKYNLREIKVKEGQKITVELVHTGKMPKGTMGHNFVLLKEGVNLGDFAREALKHQDNEFIPKDMKDIIAHTKMIGGGEKTSVTFDAPAKGTYEFLCTFTGHSAMMRGKFIVE